MAKTIVLSERDHQRLQELMRWYDRHKNDPPKFRKHLHSPQGSGTTAKYVKIIRSLHYADDTSDPDDMPVTGYDDYICRDNSLTYNNWQEIAYNLDDYVLGTPEYNDDTQTRVYKCIQPHTGEAENKPKSGAAWATYWTIETEIRPSYLAAESESGYDKRDYFPWFAIDDIVPIINRGSIWYFDQAITRAGPANGCSLRWNQDDNRLMGVFK